MATKTWTGSVSADWFTAGNWTGGIPGTTDDAVIGTTTTSPTIGGTPLFTIQSLTINGSDTLTVGDATSGISVFLTATNGITLSGGASMIGEGNITGNITATGAATLGVKKVNDQNTPEFVVTGTITDTGNALTLLVGDDPDILMLVGPAAAHAVNFNGHKGELDIYNNTLTVSGPMAVGDGTVFLDSPTLPPAATLIDNSGVTLGNGTIMGRGTVVAPVTATGTASIMARSGAIELSGPIVDSGAGLALSIYAAGDSLLLDNATQAAAHSANLDNVKGTLELNGVSLTVGSKMAIGGSTVKLDGGTSGLIDTAGITISTGTIIGSGKVGAGITASAGAAIVASGGTLEILGLVDTGNAVALSITGDTDKLVINKNATAHTASFNGASGTLMINSTGTLNVNTDLAIGSGKVKLNGAGAVLSDLTESISTGTIAGAGLVQGVVTATGAAHITATGGRLEFANQVTDAGNALTLAIASDNDILQLDFNATAHAISFNGASGTLELHNQGGNSLVVGTQLAVGTGRIQLDSAIYTLTDAGGITLGGGAIVGVGHISGALSGDGTVTASGGALDLQTAIGASAGPAFQIAYGATNLLQVDSTVGTGNVFSFLGNTGKLVLGSPGGFTGTISGFVHGDVIDLKNFVAAGEVYANNTLILLDGGNNAVTLGFLGNHTLGEFSFGTDGAGGTLINTSLVPAPFKSPVVLGNYGWAQGWGSPDNPRMTADVDGNGTMDYVGFGASSVYVSYGGTYASGQGTGPGFSGAVASVNDFGTSEGYTASVQRGVAPTSAGTGGDTIYGQGFAGVYWYAPNGEAAKYDAAGNPYYVLQYQSTPSLYGNFGSQQGWTPSNGFQIVRATTSDAYASIIGFGANGIVVGPQAFAPGATAADSYVIPFAAGNNFGWDQQTDIRTITDGTSNTIDLNEDGVADFVGMGPNGLAYAYGNTSGPGGAYELSQLQTAHINGANSDLGDAQGWNNATTPRDIVRDPLTGRDDILAFGAAGVYVSMGQDPATHGGEPFGQLYLAMPDFGSDQGWSVSQTPRIVGDVNGDGIPDIVGFGASSTFVAIGSRDGSGNLHFALDASRTVNDFGYNEAWSGTNPQTVRALGDVAGTGHSDLILSGAFNTQVWQYS